MRCYRAGWLLLLLPGWVSAAEVRPTVSMPVGDGDLTAIRVTTPGASRAVTIETGGASRRGIGTGVSRSSVDTEREGWVYLPGYVQGFSGTVAGLGPISPDRPAMPIRVVAWCTAAVDHDVERALAIGLTDTGRTDAVAALTRYDDLPPLSLALKHLDSIVLDAPGLGRRPDLCATLRSYLLEGGRLVVCPAARAEVASAPELAAYLPFDGQGKLRDGAWSAGGMAMRAVGRGHLVLMAPGDPRDPERWRRARLNTGLYGRSLGPSTGISANEQLASMLDDGRSGPTPWLLAYLAGYLVCIVPWRQRQRHWRQRQRHWWRTPVLAIAFLAGAPLLQRYAGRQRTVAFQGTVLAAASGERYAGGSAIVTVSPGRCDPLWLEARPGRCLPAWLLYQSPLAMSPTRTAVTRGRLLVNPCRSVKGTAPRAEVDWTEDLGGAVTLAVTDRAGRLSGQVTNGSRHALRGAVLVGTSGCVTLGDLAAGATVVVPDRPPVVHANLGGLLESMAAAAGQRAAARPRHRRDEQAVSLSERKVPALVAWIDGDLDDELAIVPPPSTTRRLRLLYVALPVRGPKYIAGGWRRLARPGRQDWQAAPVGKFGWPASALAISTSARELHVWVPAEQRWEKLALRMLPPREPGRTAERGATLKPASRYLRDGYLVVGGPDGLPVRPDGSLGNDLNSVAVNTLP